MRMLLFMHPTIWSILVLIMPLSIWLLTRASISSSSPPASPLDFSSISRMFSRANEFGTNNCLSTIVQTSRWLVFRANFCWKVDGATALQFDLKHEVADFRIEERTKRPNPSIVKININQHSKHLINYISFLDFLPKTKTIFYYQRL